MKLVVYQQPTCLCIKMEFVVGTISRSCELFSLCKAAFVHVRLAQMFTENCVWFTCAVLWKLHGWHRIFDIAVHACDCIYSGV